MLSPGLATRPQQNDVDQDPRRRAGLSATGIGLTLKTPPTKHPPLPRNSGPTREQWRRRPGCHDGATGIQISDQSAKSEQLALGFSAAEQKGAKNSNDRSGSVYGSDGDVWQTNSVDSDAKASNKNDVDQDATQTQSAGSGSGLGIQVSNQESKNEQAALAASIAKQDGAKNDNSPIRVLSPGKGGKVVQTNSVDSDASAKNSNDVDQTVDQTQRVWR